MLRVGMAGSVVTALCCFTPILAVGLAAVGLSAFIDWLDPVLLPTLAIFLAITGYATWQRHRHRMRTDKLRP